MPTSNVLKVISCFFSNNRFPEFMKSNQLQKLTYENMSHILDSNDLKVMSELDVFAATLKWIMYDHSRLVRVRDKLFLLQFFEKKTGRTQTNNSMQDIFYT